MEGWRETDLNLKESWRDAWRDRTHDNVRSRRRRRERAREEERGREDTHSLNEVDGEMARWRDGEEERERERTRRGLKAGDWRAEVSGRES